MINKPLSELFRPKSLDFIAGQKHLVNPKDGIITRMLATNNIKSMIFTGPPGTGKSTIAEIIAAKTDLDYHKLNAVATDSKEMRDALNISESKKVLLYLDEIQYLNKKQQQLLYPYIESGAVVLIANTTENPYFALQDALLSRCIICEFNKISAEELSEYLIKLKNTPVTSFTAHTDAVTPLVDISDDTLNYIARIVSGDVRRAFNLIETALLITDKPDIDTIDKIIPSTNQSGFDKDGDLHYQYISALQKSIRGSDPDASVFWLCKLLAGGDILSPCRRLPVIACEDIGLADPQAIIHTMECIRAAEMIGLPEAYKPLTQAVLYLALAPKSASNEGTYEPIVSDIRNGAGGTVPKHIASMHAPCYIWPYGEPYHYVNQQYMPDDIKDKTYYKPSDAPFEKQRYDYWKQVKDYTK